MSWPLSSLAVSPFDSVPFARPKFHFSYKLGIVSKQNLRAQILTSSPNPSSLPHSGASSPGTSSTLLMGNPVTNMPPPPHILSALPRLSY